MPLMQRHILDGKPNLLESCFGGWIIYVWGLSVAVGGSQFELLLVLATDGDEKKLLPRLLCVSFSLFRR